MLIKSGNVWYYTTVSFGHPLCFVQQISNVAVRGISSADKLRSSAPVSTRVLLRQHSPFHPYVGTQPLPTTHINTLCVCEMPSFFITPHGIYCYHCAVKCGTIYWKIYATNRKHMCFISDGVIGIFMDFKPQAGLWTWGRTTLTEMKLLGR